MKTKATTVGAFSALLLMSSLAIPQSAEAHSPRAQELCGVVQAFDLQTRSVTMQAPKRSQPATFAFNGATRFIKDRKFTDFGALKAGLSACVYYRSPLLGKPFVTKIVWSNPQQPG